MKAGRPPAPMPENAAQIVHRAAFVGSSDRDIAAMLGVAKSTLYAHFRTVLIKRRAERREALLGAQMKFALRGQPALLIWLGKQASDNGGLGQKDELTFGDVDVQKLSDAELDAIASGKAKPRLRMVR